MAYITRAGTKVLHPRAAHIASVYETRDASEYLVYSRFSEHLLEAEDGDHLLVHPVEDTPYEQLQGHAHVLNITNGTTGLVSYENLCHHIKPFDRLMALAAQEVRQAHEIAMAKLDLVRL